jgi:hypothetical protein
VSVTPRDAESWIATAFCDGDGYVYPDMFAIARKEGGTLRALHLHGALQYRLLRSGFACNFLDAVAGKSKGGRVTTVKAKCQFGAVSKSSTIVIKQDADKKGVEVAMTNAQGKQADLGTFAHCGKILTD